MKTLFAILFCALFSLSFSQTNEETFKVKKKPQPTMPTWATTSFKAHNDSAKLTWWKTHLDGNDTISKATLRLGYSMFLSEADYECEIISFQMDFITDDKVKKLSSNRAYLSQAMAMELSTLKPGSIIIMRNILYNRQKVTYINGPPGSAIMPREINTPAEVKSTGPFRIFVTE